VIQLIRNLCRPEAPEVAIEQVALDRLTEACGPTGAVGFPPWREHQRATKRNVRLRLLLLRRRAVAAPVTPSTAGWRSTALQGNDVADCGAVCQHRGSNHASGLAVDWLEMSHSFLRRNADAVL